MVAELIRDAPIGQILRLVSKGKLFQYPEEDPNWQCPNFYTHPDALEEKLAAANRENEAAAGAEPVYPDPETRVEEVEEKARRSEELERVATFKEEDDAGSGSSTSGRMAPIETAASSSSKFSRIGSRGALQRSKTRADLEQQLTVATMDRGPSRPIAPEKTADGVILVDWYSTDDQENPQNWSLKKKIFASCQIYLYTLAVYMGSAIYAPSEVGIIQRFGVSQQVAALGLSLYVLGYGLGPLIFSPISEIPAVGRNPPYLITFALFVILLVPTSLSDSMAGLAVLRFLLGFFGSPCLATGGASIGDMYSLLKLPYSLTLWAFAATCGPALGPIISGFSVTAENWRWSQWELLWLSGPVWLLLFFFMPETSSANILYRRAQRLRKHTGNMNLKAQSEIDQANIKPGPLIKEALWRPMALMFLDPAIAFTAVYTALLYGIYYSFFEAFPLVYGELYHWNLGQQGLAFLSITVGVLIAIAIYYAWTYYLIEPYLREHGLSNPERTMLLGTIVCLLCPSGLFIFAWTAQEGVHWIGSVIGILVFSVGIFIVLQCIFLYLPLVYPQYSASLFAGNDFARSTLACGAIHFSQPLYHNLGVPRGATLMGGLLSGCVAGVYVLYFFGAKLRARSKFAAK